MNKILIIMLFISSIYASNYKEFAQKMGYETSYKKALEKAKAEDKDLLILTISNFCPWCSKLEKRVLSKAEVDTAVKNKFVALILNKEENTLPSKYKAPIVPTLYLVDPKKDEIYNTQVGYLNKTDMIRFISTPQK